MAAGEQRIVDHRFRKSLNRRVKSAVRADPDLTRRYWRTLKRKIWVGVFASPFGLFALWGWWALGRLILAQHGRVHSGVHYFAANAIGLFASLSLLGRSWRILCGTESLGTLPRLPMSDGAIYVRAWRRFSRLMFLAHWSCGCFCICSLPGM